MDRRVVFASLRAGVAGLVVAAIIVQVATTVAEGTFDASRFFAFFTIQSNLFGAAVFFALAIRWGSARSARLEWLRGAAVVYLTVTFVVVIWLLSSADLQLAVPWVDIVLHKVFPVVVVVDWLVDPPTGRLTLRDVALWLAYPFVWVT